MRPLAFVLLCGCGFSLTTTPDLVDDAAQDTAPPIDAPPDAPPVWTVVETMMIDSANGTPQISQLSLVAGMTYQLRVSGVALVIPPHEGDAEYFDFTDPKNNGCCEDIGLGIDDPVVDLMTTPDWGPYNPTHVYQIDRIGSGAPISAVYQDTLYTNNVGTLTLEILALR